MDKEGAIPHSTTNVGYYEYLHAWATKVFQYNQPLWLQPTGYIFHLLILHMSLYTAHFETLHTRACPHG